MIHYCDACYKRLDEEDADYCASCLSRMGEEDVGDMERSTERDERALSHD